MKGQPPIIEGPTLPEHEAPHWETTWEDRLQKEFTRLRRKPAFDVNDDLSLIERLHNSTLVSFNHLLDAAIKVGHPDYLLRLLRETAAISGLKGPQVAINVNSGGSEALLDYSHLTDDEISRLTRTPIETMKTVKNIALTQLPEKKRRGRKK